MGTGEGADNPFVTEVKRMPGSIEKRGKNSWRIVIPDGYEPNGKKRRITESVKFADTMTEAQQRKGKRQPGKHIVHRE